jgi:hypothetical protein
MGPSGMIHNYNQNSDFSMLNDVSSILNMSSSMDHKRTRNDNVTGHHDKFLPLKTMPSVQTHMTLDEATTLFGTPSRVNTIASHKANDYQQVGGSFLQLNPDGKKLADLSGSLVREPQSIITGLKQMKEPTSICARDEPWRIASKLMSTPERGAATNDTSMRGFDYSSREMS